MVNFLSCSCTSGFSYIYGAKCQHNTVYQSNLLCFLTSNKTKFTDQKGENFIGFTAVWSNVLVFFFQIRSDYKLLWVNSIQFERHKLNVCERQRREDCCVTLMNKLFFNIVVCGKKNETKKNHTLCFN